MERRGQRIIYGTMAMFDASSVRAAEISVVGTHHALASSKLQGRSDRYSSAGVGACSVAIGDGTP